MTGLMIFNREGTKCIEMPSLVQLDRELRRLCSSGPSSFASLMRQDGSYLQTAGGPSVLLLERRDVDGRHFRAHQETPVVPFDDGVELVFSGGRIRLLAGEWFKVQQVVDTFMAFLLGSQEPSYLRWNEITGVVE